MGYFAELWITKLDEDNEEIRNVTEYVEFSGDAYISWESKELDETQWLPKAAKTIFIKKHPNIHSRGFRYLEDFNITLMTSGIRQKEKKYGFRTSFYSQKELSLFHLLLPTLYIPEDNTFAGKPDLIKKQSSRVAMTWPFFNQLTVQFQFKKVDKKGFETYKSSGIPRRVRVDSKNLRKVKRDALETGKDILAKIVAETIKSGA